MTRSGSLALAGFDALPTQLAVLDESGDIVYTNRAWREFGEANDFKGNPDTIGVNYLEVCRGSDDEDAATAAEGIRAVLDGDREEFAFEYPCHSPDEKRWFTMWTGRFHHDGDRYVLVVHLDITDRRTAEQEVRERANRLEAVARLLAHDLRNPLSVALGYLDLVAADHADDDRIARIRTALDRMERIVTDALVFARYETIDDADTRPVTLREAVERAWESVVTGHATLVVDGSCEFYAEPDLVQHVFENLFRNAIEHVGETVTVRVGCLSDGFYIEDDGPGISPDEREDVFDPGVTTTEDGTGFGLSLVERIGDAHGWEVRLVEGDDGGARFEFTGVRRIA